MKLILSLFSSLLLALAGNGQSGFPYRIKLEPVIPQDFNGLQSYAWARSGNKVVLLGGRTDGLHRRQPFAAFNKLYNNTALIVIDLESEKTWKKSLDGFSASVTEQLQSSNMEFYQQGNQLLLVGGYGYSETKKDHITHPSLLLVQVHELIEAVVNNKEAGPFIRQLTDDRMAVAGGRLGKLGSLFYLVGGQRFDGRYNPHGPDHGPGFSQQYTNQVRKFSITEEGSTLRIENYSAITDTALLHRRDYNLLPQQDESGKKMLSVYSGVFRTDKDLPYTSVVDITETGHREQKGFEQLFSHYHTATMPAFHKGTNAVYAVFFGGIAQYYPDSNGKTIKDNDVPFVKTISVVERKGGVMKEYVLPDVMPGYFGAAAEFIPAAEKLFAPNNILQLEKLGKKPVLAGYIIGGIDSQEPNAFWSNTASATRASPVIWKVLLQAEK